MKNFLKGVTALVGALVCSQATIQAAEPTTVNHPDWSRNAVIYEVNTRQYTPEGTFEAFSAEIPRLKELGVDILWFMPIHPISELNRKGTLGSYYAVKDYKGVNPEFGTLDSFRKVVDLAHENGMKVIIDWVPNHTGCDNAWVVEHPDWFARDEKGEMYGPYDWSDVFQLDYSNPEMRRGMIDALKFWITEVGIDGFRCDVAGRVPVDFWDVARKELEAAKGEGQLFMLAEATEPELVANAFDMDYNWPMKELQNAVAATRGEYRFITPGATEQHKFPEKNASDFPALVKEQQEIYPAGSYMMNMVTNHDLNSWEGTEMERYGIYLPAMTVLTYAMPGMPLIYTGQEVALDRALEFFEKESIPEYKSLAQKGSRGSRTTEMLKALNTFKHTYPQLAAGYDNISFLPVVDEANQLIIVREAPEENDSRERVVAAMNFGNTPMDISDLTETATHTTLFSQDGLAPAATSLAPGQAAILVLPADI